MRKEHKDSPPSGLDVQRINPKRGEKFSPNLYSFLNNKRNVFIARFGHVFRDEAEDMLWLGFWNDGYFFGVPFMRVLCEGSKARTSNYLYKVPPYELSGFWNAYLEKGRCAIDPTHTMFFLNAENRFIGERCEHCNWCGKDLKQMD